MTALKMGVESTTWEIAGADGAALMVHSWLPRGGADWAIVAIHGATSHAGWFAPLGRALARRGIATHAPDRRGSGRLRQLELPAAPEVWIDDLRRVVKAVRARGKRVCLAPWSFGVKLGVPAIRSGCEVDHLLLLAPAFVFSARVADQLAAGVSAAGSHAPLPASDEDFVEASAARAFLAADALRWRTMPKAFRMLSDRLNLMMRDQLPQLDTRITGVFASRDRITDSESGREILADLGHEALSVDGGHSFFLDDPEGAAKLIRELLV
ncbi:MAG TPA: alpha/beta fold hydrolase [Kofleriaceae bacterium]|nr:alpha/beta fold hydrolase [Kofleriaceae bacterium]